MRRWHEEKPVFIIGTPMCTASSILQQWNYPRLVTLSYSFVHHIKMLAENARFSQSFVFLCLLHFFVVFLKVFVEILKVFSLLLPLWFVPLSFAVKRFAHAVRAFTTRWRPPQQPWFTLELPRWWSVTKRSAYVALIFKNRPSEHCEGLRKKRT